jgi:hypothetical protein
MRAFLFGLTLALLSGADASASVILRLNGQAYQGWPESNPPVFSFSGRVVISDAAFASGDYSLRYFYFSATDPGLIERNGVEDFSFDLLTHAFFFDSPFTTPGSIDIHGGIGGTKFPSVVIYDWDNKLWLEGLSAETNYFGTDYGLYGCAVHCVVRTMTWTVERAPAVPEPASAALLGAGALLLAACRGGRRGVM